MRKSPHVGTHARAGVTLIELTIVLSIAALLFVVAIPRFALLRDRWAVRSAMTDLGASFSLARQTAIARRAPVAVVLDTVGGVVHLRSAAGAIHQSTLFASYGVSLGSSRDSAVYDP